MSSAMSARAFIAVAWGMAHGPQNLGLPSGWPSSFQNYNMPDTLASQN